MDVMRESEKTGVVCNQVNACFGWLVIKKVKIGNSI